MKATYTIDSAHSSAQFVVRHLMISNVRGGFEKVSGTVELDTEDPTAATIDTTIDASTLKTLDDQRDAHVKSAEFLDVDKYPAIHFKSTKIEPAGSGEWKVAGNLTIRDVTKSVVLHVEGPTPESKDPWGNLRIGASASTKIKRSDFGLTWNAALETGGVVLSDDLKIELEVQMIKAQSAQAA